MKNLPVYLGNDQKEYLVLFLCTLLCVIRAIKFIKSVIIIIFFRILIGEVKSDLDCLLALFA